MNQELLQVLTILIRDLGFPVFVALYLLMRTTAALERIEHKLDTLNRPRP